MTCPLFVELCAGTAALSLRLHHPRARPPVSRMGAKTGYAGAILRCLGLRPGGQAERYLWCEPDAGVRLLLHAYTDRALAMAAADIIRSWKDEDPRALWERLRAEGPAVCPPVDAREVARVARIISANRLVNPDPITWQNTGNGGYKHGGAEFCTPIPRLAESMAAVPRVDGVALVDDARKVDPMEVARWCTLAQSAYRRGDPDSGFDDVAARAGVSRGACLPPAQTVAKRWVVATLPATIADDARTVPTPPRLPAGTVAYIDPPYKDTTGYAHAFPRSEWLPVVRRWKDAGALVCVSEAEPIPDLMAEGWHAVEITGERKGQRRTFSKQQREWLTMSEPPRWRPSVQGRLFK